MKLWDKNLGGLATVCFASAAIASFHLAYMVRGCQIFILVFLFCLFHLANARNWRWAFYSGLLVGLAIYSPHLDFFWTLFGGGAVALWVVLSCWLGLFLALGRLCLGEFGPAAWACAAPFFWTGLEYFRSELYYLRFSWLNAGYAFANSPALHYLGAYGVYGIGFVLMSVAVGLAMWPRMSGMQKFAAIIAGGGIALFPTMIADAKYPVEPPPRFTGIQLEFPTPAEAVAALDKAIHAFPDTRLFVLSEYAFTQPVPPLVTKWCRKHNTYLAAGGEVPTTGKDYYNTVFVVDNEGDIVFDQAKCVPVQFMKDGLPATKQALWNSPWGMLGFGVCYDASYTRVTDELVRLGAQGLIFPTMDVADWGAREHRMHSRIAPMRAAEYHLPVLRVCSSGISQYVDPSGRVDESAPFPGDGAIISAQFEIVTKSRVPPDRWLAKICVIVTILATLLLALEIYRQRMTSFILKSI
jgi:apolipoprotein N-acyltransferase